MKNSSTPTSDDYAVPSTLSVGTVIVFVSLSYVGNNYSKTLYIEPHHSVKSGATLQSNYFNSLFSFSFLFSSKLN